MKIWCEYCKGLGTWYERTRTSTGIHEQEIACMFCGGLGYKEIEGTQEDIELAKALHFALSNGYTPIHQGQKIYRINLKIGTTEQHSIELIEWYREQKESEHNE